MSGQFIRATPHGTPFFTYQDGRLVLVERNRQSSDPDPSRQRMRGMVADVMNRSHLLSLMNAAQSGLRRRREELRPAPASAASSSGIPKDYMRFWPYIGTRDPKSPADPRLTDAWVIAGDLLRLMRGECAAHGAEMWLVTIEMVMQIEDDPAVRSAFQHRHNLATLDATDRHLDQFAQSANIHSLLLAPRMVEYAREHHAVLHGFRKTGLNGGHWNEDGHWVADGLIAAELVRSSATLRYE